MNAALQLLLIGLGGCFGAVSRFVFNQWVSREFVKSVSTDLNFWFIDGQYFWKFFGGLIGLWDSRCSISK